MNAPISDGSPLGLIFVALAVVLVAGVLLVIVSLQRKQGSNSVDSTVPSVQIEGDVIMGDGQTGNVVVKDIKMGFGSMVVFMIKWVLASIPAMIILSLISLAIGAVAGGLFGGLLN